MGDPVLLETYGVAESGSASSGRVDVRVIDHSENPAAFQVAVVGKEADGLNVTARVRGFENSPTGVVDDLKTRMKEQMGLLLDTGRLVHEGDWVPLSYSESRSYQEMYEDDPDKLARLMLLEQLDNKGRLEAAYSTDFTRQERGQIFKALYGAEQALHDVLEPVMEKVLKEKYPEVYRKYVDAGGKGKLIGYDRDDSKLSAQDRLVVQKVRSNIRRKVFGRAGAEFLDSFDRHYSVRKEELYKSTPSEKLAEIDVVSEADAVMEAMDDIFPKRAEATTAFSVLEGVTDRQGRAILLNTRSELSKDGRMMRSVRETVSLSTVEDRELVSSKGKTIKVSEYDQVVGMIRMDEIYYRDLRFLSEVGANPSRVEDFKGWLRKDVKKVLG